MPAKKLQLNFLFIVVLFIFTALRVWKLDIPIIEPYNSLTRQAMVASVARNFYENGFNFFYPEIDENGPGPYLFNGEAPINSYLMAIAYKISGGVHEYAARAVSVLFSLATLLLLWVFVKREYGDKAAFFTALFLCLSPQYLALSRSIQPEAPMIFFITAAVITYIWCAQKKSKVLFYISAVSAALAMSVKIQSIFVLLPIFFMMLQKDRIGLFRHRYFWIYVFILFFPLLWYFWMWKLGQSLPLAYSPYDFKTNRGPEGVAYWMTFLPPYLWIVLKYLFGHILTPLGAVFVFLGCKKTFTESQKYQNLIYWLLGYFIYLFVFWRFCIDHSYYQIPCIAVAAVLFGVGANDFFANYSKISRNLKITMTLILIAGSIFVSKNLYKGVYLIPESNMQIIATGKKVQQLTPKRSLVIATYGTSSVQLYYCHRKGWSFFIDLSKPETLTGQLLKLKERGAEYFATSEVQRLQQSGPLYEYLSKHAKLVTQDRDFLLYKL